MILRVGEIDAANVAHRPLNAIVLCVVLTGLLSGCTNLGPDYVQPEAEVESEWLESGDPLVSSQPPADPAWWKNAFHDADLDRLVDTALEQNLTLRSAGLRVLQAQQQLAIAIGAQFPQQQQITGSTSRQKSGGVTFDDYSVGFNLGWEVDVWGRYRRLVESASAELDASVANFDGSIVSIVSQVAQTYILIRTFQERVAVAKNNIKLQTSSLEIAQAKFDAGDVSELDVDQAEALLNNTKAALSSLEGSLQQLKNSLASLLGRAPHELNYLLGGKAVIPSAPAEIALGMPQDLIRRRPDILVAERNLAAQSAEIGFAVTELYPHFFIGGSVGTSAMDTGDLFDNDSKTWQLFGMFEWNIFNYGRLKSNVRLQDAFFQQLLVDYRNTVLLAQADVENTIVAYLKAHEQVSSDELAEKASARAVDVSNIQYENGAVNFNTVITILRDHAEQQDRLASTRGTVATNLVQIYRAIGGGWEIRAGRDPVDLLPASMKDEMRTRTKYWEGVLE
jgi:NodT family efflux transporter outer membrane factor (OMF) lipoprotein